MSMSSLNSRSLLSTRLSPSVDLYPDEHRPRHRVLRAPRTRSVSGDTLFIPSINVFLECDEAPHNSGSVFLWRAFEGIDAQGHTRREMEDDTVTQARSQASSSRSPGSSTMTRTQRGAIAVQACDTCRSRKQKCDEQRPQCSTCQKFRLECRYREPQPTKKDKTLVEILNRLKILEGKIDKLSGQDGVRSSEHGSVSSHPLVQTPEAIGANAPGVGTSLASAILPPPFIEALEPHGSASLYRYSSSVHDMLTWPAVQELVADVLPTSSGSAVTPIDQSGASVLLTLHQSAALPTTVLAVGSGSSVRNPQMLGNAFVISHLGHALTWNAMQTLSTAFFETFNLLHPIVDRQHFLSTTLPTILAHGLDDSVEATLAYLIFALGEVAIAESQGSLASTHDGLRGGTGETYPPGLLLFNEARRRMGFYLASCTLSTVQFLALAGLYYGTTFYHAEVWRMTASASLACQALITVCRPEELTRPYREISRRVFWHCSIMETFLELELGLPSTGLAKHEARVPVPDFDGGFAPEDHVANETSHFQEHFASQIVLRRLATDFNAVLNSVSLAEASTANTASSKSNVPETIKLLAMQLDHWRETLLPAHLHWRDDGPESLPDPYGAPDNLTNAQHTTKHPSSDPNVPSQVMFTPDLTSQPVCYPYAMDIQVALLRTRFYATKHLIHRPYLHKALHAPSSSLTQQDAEGVATCLRACLKWPITMSPVCSRKRLIPCGFFWTQNLLGVLVVLWMSERIEVLRRVRMSGLCGEQFEVEAAETVRLAVQWMRDLRKVDGAAGAAWEVVKGIYGLQD